MKTDGSPDLPITSSDPGRHDLDHDLAVDPQNLTRRDVLTVGAGAVVTLAVGACARQSAPTTPRALLAHVKDLDIDPIDPRLLGEPAPGAGYEKSEIVTARTGPLPAKMKVEMAEGKITFLDEDAKCMEQSDSKCIERDDGIWMQRDVCVRAYNGKFPGPTGYYRAGDALEFTLENALPPLQHPSRTKPAVCGQQQGAEGEVVPRAPWRYWSDEQLMRHNVPHGFNVTNLHTHGLHVSPGTNDRVSPPESSDDVHVKCKPKNYPYAKKPEEQEPRKYRIQLPDFHAPGTHWYHAHIHGSTALQVANGLAGALIIAEPEGEELRTDGGRVIPDGVFLIQEIIGSGLDHRVYGNMLIEGDDEDPIYGGIPSADTKFTVNGDGDNKYLMPANEFRRLRLINGTGTPRGFMGLEIIDSHDLPQPFYLVAIDGITRYGKRLKDLEVRRVEMLEPGARVDILVQLPVGDYTLCKLDRRIGPHPPAPTRSEDLMQIEVTRGGSTPQALPERLPALPDEYCYLRPITDAELTGARTVTFAVDRDKPVECPPNEPARFGDFKIAVDPPEAKPRPYGDPQGGPPPKVDVRLNSVEEWTIVNTSCASHPFHIHVNPFQVVEENKAPSEWIWRDVVEVPPQKGNTPGKVTIRHRFLNYPGKFVIHCHVLAHEDAGMMWDMEVLDDPNNPGARPGDRLSRCNCPTCR